MTEADILKTAAQTERDGRAFYLKAAKEASNELGAKMFQAFAREEQKHLVYIEGLMANRHVKFEQGDILAAVKNIFSEAPESLRKQAKATKSDREAIAFGKEIETKSYDFYTKWGKESDSEKARELCQTLAEEENKHYRLFANIEEYLDRNGDWNMVEEGWMFDGG